MTAEEYLKQGDINSALEQLQGQVKKDPANAKLRIFLFQILAVMGQWERALTQLKVAGELDAGALAMVTMYKMVIDCEQYREQVFLGQQEPVIFGEPNEWVAMLIQAIKFNAQGEHKQAQGLRDMAFELAPVCSGSIDDVPFEWLADSDPRLGPMLEVMIGGRYLWLPMENVTNIEIDEPKDLRDVVWLPARFTWTNGGGSYGLIPSRYPFSYQHDDALALSRKTEWQESGTGLYTGLGQKLWATDENEYALMDTRSIQFKKAMIMAEGQ
ncbi:MAG: tetratricopeptide repeat protein [Methyloprofundus sp.]|nr:tetratricopeptide repeat protein [Methyloprofundus sp.]